MSNYWRLWVFGELLHTPHQSLCLCLLVYLPLLFSVLSHSPKETQVSGPHGGFYYKLSLHSQWCCQKWTSVFKKKTLKNTPQKSHFLMLIFIMSVFFLINIISIWCCLGELCKGQQLKVNCPRFVLLSPSRQHFNPVTVILLWTNACL